MNLKLNENETHIENCKYIWEKVSNKQNEESHCRQLMLTS